MSGNADLFRCMERSFRSLVGRELVPLGGRSGQGAARRHVTVGYHCGQTWLISMTVQLIRGFLLVDKGFPG